MRITVTLAKNGEYWQARWKSGAGKKRCRGLGKRRECGGEVSARQAERMRRQLESDLNVGRAMVDEAPTLKAHVERFLKNETELSEGTRYLYELTGGLLKAHFGDTLKLDRVTPADAEDWEGAVARGELSDRDEAPAVATVRGHVRRAKRLFGSAGLPSNPFAGLKGRSPKATKDWETVTLADLDKLLDACPSHGWRCLFALTRLAGLRRGEALRLRWADVDLDGRRLTVVPDVDYETTKKRTRQVPIQAKLYDTLWTAWMDADGHEWVVTGDGIPQQAASLWKASRALIQRSGFKPWKKPLHTLRKNLETEWAREYPITVLTEWLGHAPEVALEHYTRAEDEDFAKAAGLGAGNVELVEVERVVTSLEPSDLAALVHQLAEAAPETWAEVTQSLTQSAGESS